jgi:hypothetical protein
MGLRTYRKAWPRWRLPMAPSTATLLADSKLTLHQCSVNGDSMGWVET